MGLQHGVSACDFSMVFQRVRETAGSRAIRGFHHAETPLTEELASACSKTAGGRANRGLHHAETSLSWLDVSACDFSMAFQHVPETAGSRASRGPHHAETPSRMRNFGHRLKF